MAASARSTPGEVLYLSVRDAAAMLGVSEDHIRRHAPIRYIGRLARVPMAWVRHDCAEEVEHAEAPVGLRTRVQKVRRKVGGTGAPARRHRGVRHVLPVAGGGEGAAAEEPGAEGTVYEFPLRRRVPRTVAR